MENLEKRMYFFTMYNLDGIQKGIQCGHAALEYAHLYNDDEEYIDFIENHKTWIILNGGTSNNMGKTFYNFDEYYGSMEEILNYLKDNNIKYASFNEPDLNNATSAICFICDEKVFNYKDYPQFKDWLLKEKPLISMKIREDYINMMEDDFNNKYSTEYNKWVKFLGGNENILKRNIIKNKKLA